MNITDTEHQHESFHYCTDVVIFIERRTKSPLCPQVHDEETLSRNNSNARSSVGDLPPGMGRAAGFGTWSPGISPTPNEFIDPDASGISPIPSPNVRTREFTGIKLEAERF